MNRFWKITLFMILLLVSNVVHAKYIPFLEDSEAEWGGLEQPFEVPETLTFHRLYGRLGEYGDVDAFTYTFDKAVKDWRITVAVPQCSTHFEAVQPSVAIVGNGLDTGAKNLPFELPDGAGAVILDPEKGTTIGDYFDREEVQFGYQTQVGIPAEGIYTLVVWEPQGHTGAYSLDIGNVHPESMEGYTTNIAEVFRTIESGEWMGQDCDAPVAVESCPSTEGIGNNPNRPEEEAERSVVGEGYILTGVVRDSTTCLPVSEATVVFWMANPEGEYDEDHTGKLLTNRQGTYRIQSDKPGGYGPDPHIHLSISAPGYTAIETVYALTESPNEDSGVFDIGLNPVK